jgi:hypothetical protein
MVILNFLEGFFFSSKEVLVGNMKQRFKNSNMHGGNQKTTTHLGEQTQQPWQNKKT